MADTSALATPTRLGRSRSPSPLPSPSSRRTTTSKPTTVTRLIGPQGLATLRQYYARLTRLFGADDRDSRLRRRPHDTREELGEEEEELLLHALDPRADDALRRESQTVSSTTTRPTPKENPTAHLNGLRGLAAFVVFVSHYMMWFGEEGTQSLNNFGYYQDGDPNHTYLCTLPFIRLLYSGGSVAVNVFFVLSGYVLSIGPLAKMKRVDGSPEGQVSIRKGLVGAVVRRPFRLDLPPIIISFGIALLWQVPGPLVLQVRREPNLWAELVAWFHAVLDMFIPWNHGTTILYIPAAWTMPIELHGSFWTYLVAFIASFLLTASRARASLFAGGLALTAVVLLHTGQGWANVNFLLGIVLAVIDTWSLDSYSNSGKGSNRIRSVATHVLLVVALYLLSQPTSGYAGSMSTPGWRTLTQMVPPSFQGTGEHIRYWATWGAFMLVYVTSRIPWLRNFFLRPSLQYLGKVSFMLYLVHLTWMVIALVRWHEMLGGVDPPAGGADNPPEPRTLWYQDLLRIPDIGPLGLNTRFLASMLVAVPTTLALADFLTRWVDEPCIAFAEKLAGTMGLGKESSNKAPGSAEQPMLPMARL